MAAIHKPVLLKEVIEIFDPQPGEKYIDATVNGGGHARALLEKIGAGGKLLGIDWDCRLVESLKKEFRFSVKGRSDSTEKNLILTCDNYANLELISTKYNFSPPTGILFDLGFSTHQLEGSERGFSFLRDEPLDMRYNLETNDHNAEKIINTWPIEAIEDILRNYGEERYARKIAKAIIAARRAKKITKTGELLKIVLRVVPRRGRVHPATRTFQALRMAVNKELENIEQGLMAAEKILAPGGKVVVISFHSLEDRAVKNFFKERAKQGDLKIITQKPVIASREEQLRNPRSRSAKLRAAQKLNP